MKIDNINNYVRGWIFGMFEPSLLKTEEFEFSIKKYKTGDFELKHHHKIATEYTIIISGKVKFNGVEYGPDDIVIIEPNESTDFLCVEDAVSAVIKYPGAQNDKYIDKKS